MTLSTFDATSEVTQDPVISRTTLADIVEEVLYCLFYCFYFILHLTPPSSPHLLISEDDGDSSDDEDDNNNDDDDDDTAADDDNDDDDDDDANDDPDDLFPMAKMAPKKRGAAAGEKKATPKIKTTGEETIDLDTPPRKKQQVPAACYSTEKRGCYTVNPYAHSSKNKIDVVLHEGGVPSKDAQPQVSLLLGGKTLSVQWKTSEKLFSELQASAQGIARDSSRFMGYSNTMQEMKKAGVVAIEGYYRGPPQIIKLDVECTGEPKVKICPFPQRRPCSTRVSITYNSTPCMCAR